ncbi:solute carrier organic anion transporter family member 2B1 [Gastrophryne carolinensis]
MTATGQSSYGDTGIKSSRGFRNPFHNIKVFVLCHGLLQLSQLLLSGYLKSSISTIEKRFGLSSQTSGILASFNEIGNTVLIVFVSYFGCRVHRPRFIAFGALIVCAAGFIMCLPHFIMGQYEYDKSVASVYSNATDICHPTVSSDANNQCAKRTSTGNADVLSILFIGQILLGIGGVPIQPFGISYIDDYASKRNSPLYIGILFAVTVMGPGVAFILGSAMLRYYVDIDKLPADEIVLTPSDPRWIGAWWLGFIVAASIVALTSIPYFFFPREMPREHVANESEEEQRKPALIDAFHNKSDPSDPVSMAKFIKVFPKVLLKTMKNPIYILVVFAQASLSAMICGLATFMAKFLERQFTITASFANLMIGSVNIPGAMAGIVLGGIIMKRFQFSLRQCGAMCVFGMLCCILISLPLLFLGCSTQQFASPHADPHLSIGLWHNASECGNKCGCSNTAFNPICGSDGVEYISPCYAGCKAVNFDYKENKVMNYTRCSCISSEGSGGTATPGSCGTGCFHLFLPFMVLSCLGGILASLSQTPSFMLILRSVNPTEKSLAIGIQFMLLRILAWLPGPVMFGSMIDSTCILWGKKCGSKAACQYYNTDLLRQRYLGLQLLFEIGALILFIAVYFVLRKKEKIQIDAEKNPENHVLSEKKATVKV